MTRSLDYSIRVQIYRHITSKYAEKTVLEPLRLQNSTKILWVHGLTVMQTRTFELAKEKEIASAGKRRKDNSWFLSYLTRLIRKRSFPSCLLKSMSSCPSVFTRRFMSSSAAGSSAITSRTSPTFSLSISKRV